MITQTKDSFYLERLKRFYETHNHYQSKVGDSHNSIWGLSSRTKLEHYCYFEVKDILFHEQEYKGFQLIIKETQFIAKTILDKNGLPCKDAWLDVKDIGGYIDQQDQATFVAFAWEIGGDYDTLADLNWLGMGAIINQLGTSNSLKKTTKTAQKKLDILAQVHAVKDTLIQIADERLNYNEAVNPFNVIVGDQVWIDAHGRKRKGVITSTTGSRFNVAYLTPSNHNDLKYKTLGIPHLFVKESP
jgi:hypothetical protein